MAMLYVALLAWAQFAIIGSTYRYMGFDFADPVPLLWYVGVGLALVPTLSLMFYSGGRGDALTWSVWSLAYVPAMLVYPALQNAQPLQDRLPIMVALLIGFLVLAAPLPMPRRLASRAGVALVERRRPAMTLLGCLVVVFSMIVAVRFGIPHQIPTIDDVYNVRATYRVAIGEGGRWVSYLVGWQAGAVIPLALAFAIAWRSVALAALGVASAVHIYSLTGFKSVLISPLLVGCIALFLKIFRRDVRLATVALWTSGAVVAVLLTSLAEAVPPLQELGLLGTQRLYALQGLIASYYFEFFSEHHLVLMRHSIGGLLDSNPFPLEPPFLIGQAYFGNPAASANGSLFCDAFANWGAAGILAYACAARALVLLLDIVPRHSSVLPVASVALIAGFNLANSALPTVMNTQGLLLGLVLLFVLRKLSVVRPQARYLLGFR
jgi:hypothetical protein